MRSIRALAKYFWSEMQPILSPIEFFEQTKWQQISCHWPTFQETLLTFAQSQLATTRLSSKSTCVVVTQEQGTFSILLTN